MELCLKTRYLVRCWNLFSPPVFYPALSQVDHVRHYAARKGTREKARKKKVKVEIKKAVFVPHNLREKVVASTSSVPKRLSDDMKFFPVDDVYVAKYHKWKVYDFEEAIQCHRETHHPTVYNVPNAPVHAFIELDMRGAKKNKFVDNFSRISKVAKEFNHGENRSILVFCKTQELKEEAEAAGATLVGDADAVKKIQRGDIVLPDFQYILAHPNILPELVSLRGLLKKKFPSPKLGTLSPDIGEMVRTFKSGVQYKAIKDEVEQDYGWIDAIIGPLNMDVRDLEGNLKNLVEDVTSVRPKREGPFITRIMIKSPPSVEKLKLNLAEFLPEDFVKDEYESDSDDEPTKK